MRKNCKDTMIAEAHRNPEYARMSSKQLANFIDADQTTISVWRRKMYDTVSMFESRIHSRASKDKPSKDLTDDYELICNRFDKLSEAYIDLSNKLKQLENRSWLSRLFNLKG